MDGGLLEETELENRLLNNRYHGNIYIEPQEDFSQKEIHTLKALYEDLFDRPPRGQDAKSLGKETQKALTALIEDIKGLLKEAKRYPFLKNLEPVISRLMDCTGKSYSWYIKEFVKFEDELLEIKEDLIDPIKGFMSGQQREIYDDAIEFLEKQGPNLGYIKSEGLDEIQRIINDPKCFLGNKMPALKDALSNLKTKLDEKLREEKDLSKATLERLKQKLFQRPGFSSISIDAQNEFEEAFNTAQDAIQKQTLIAMIRDKVRTFEAETYPRLLNKLTSASTPRESHGYKESTTEEETCHVKESTEPTIVSIASLKVQFNKACIEDEADIETYLTALRKALAEKIEGGVRIFVSHFL